MGTRSYGQNTFLITITCCQNKKINKKISGWWSFCPGLCVYSCFFLLSKCLIPVGRFHKNVQRIIIIYTFRMIAIPNWTLKKKMIVSHKVLQIFELNLLWLQLILIPNTYSILVQHLIFLYLFAVSCAWLVAN